jgi:DNA-binding MarR family transcriptional regulator
MTPTDTDVNPLALENQVCFALAVASRSVIALYRPVLEPLGLTHPQYLVMLALWEDDPRSVSDLGTTLQLEPATLSPLVKRLEAAGYLTRTRASGDERRLDIELTAAGRALRTKALRVPEQIVALLDVPIETLEQTRDLLKGLIDAAVRAR